MNAFVPTDRNLQAFHCNIIAFGKQGHFAKPLQTGTRIKLVVQAESQRDNITTLPLLTAIFVQPVRPVAQGTVTEVNTASVTVRSQPFNLRKDRVV